MPEEGILSQIKRFVVGNPIPSHLAHHERLSRVTGLAVLSSDPLSSVAYATEEILRVLILVNVSALAFASPIAVIIRSEEHTSELQSRLHLVCRLLLEKKKK